MNCNCRIGAVILIVFVFFTCPNSYCSLTLSSDGLRCPFPCYHLSSALRRRVETIHRPYDQVRSTVKYLIRPASVLEAYCIIRHIMDVTTGHLLSSNQFVG